MAWIDKHLGEERTMNNGLKAKIIGGKSTDLTVQFEDGTVVENKMYGNFKTGRLSKPKCIWIDKHLNEERTMNNGQKAKIIGGKYNDLTIQLGMKR